MLQPKATWCNQQHTNKKRVESKEMWHSLRFSMHIYIYHISVEPKLHVDFSLDAASSHAQHSGEAIHLSLQHPKITGLVDVIESSEAQRGVNDGGICHRGEVKLVIEFDDLP